MTRLGRVWSFTALAPYRGKGLHARLIVVHIESEQRLVLGRFGPDSADDPVIGMSVELESEDASCLGSGGADCESWRKART